MSDAVQHECGVALVRLRKPLEYYYEKYGTPLWGFFKLFLLMEKQHNRGQDGAGVASVKLDVPPGYPYIFRERNMKSNPLDRIFDKLFREYNDMVRKGIIHPEFTRTVKENFNFGGEILLGHLRYGTSGGYNIHSCHPYFRRSNWPTKNLILAGNFNITNNRELNEQLIGWGQHPIFDTDTQTLLEGIGFHLDQAHDQLYRDYRDKSELQGADIAENISQNLDFAQILRDAAVSWDGGYSIAGAIGNGDCFAFRDPHAIRPFHYVINDEVIAFASERAPLMTVFENDIDDVKEVEPGTVVVVKHDGEPRIESFAEPRERTSCVFERIYFSRSNDHDIYQERKRLGAGLTDPLMKLIDNDLDHTVFSFIPNTAEIAFFGLTEELRKRRRREVVETIMQAHVDDKLTNDMVGELIMYGWPRAEKVAHKDIKLRTFISQENDRNQMAAHVYDISYGSIHAGDILVCVDDSIVRGTTLKNSVIRILSRLKPSKIIIASTAPQIRYPDCYGIDMSQLGKFIAFQAAIALLREQGAEELIHDVYRDCLGQADKPLPELVNHVARIYERFTPEEIAAKISELARPEGNGWDGELIILYQTIDQLHRAVPEHSGDWYFSGNYPTPGGYRVLNQAFINFFEDSELRSY
jgi:amidophosphoribosyltransferase